MDDLLNMLPESWVVYITCAVTICAAIAAVLPAPKDSSGSLYRLAYRLVQWIGLNLGQARNADDKK